MLAGYGRGDRWPASSTGALEPGLGGSVRLQHAGWGALGSVLAVVD